MHYRVFQSCFVFFFAFFLTVNIFAQENPAQMELSLYGGVALPQGDFRGTTGEKAGFANTGFSGMIEGNKLLSESLNWLSSVSIAFNRVDESALEDQLSGINVSADSYITTWIMTGLGVEAVASPTVKLYGLGQLGLLLSRFPDITLSSNGESITQTTKMGTAFAYGFGAGLVINNTNFGVRFYTGEPEYEQSASYMGQAGTAKTTMPASILQLVIGFRL